MWIICFVSNGNRCITGEGWGITFSTERVKCSSDSGNALKPWHRAITKMCRVVAAGHWVSHWSKASNFCKSNITKVRSRLWEPWMLPSSFPSSFLKLSLSQSPITKVSKSLIQVDVLYLVAKTPDLDTL